MTVVNLTNHENFTFLYSLMVDLKANFIGCDQPNLTVYCIHQINLIHKNKGILYEGKCLYLYLLQL